MAQHLRMINAVAFCESHSVVLCCASTGRRIATARALTITRCPYTVLGVIVEKADSNGR